MSEKDEKKINVRNNLIEPWTQLSLINPCAQDELLESKVVRKVVRDWYGCSEEEFEEVLTAVMNKLKAEKLEKKDIY